MTESVRLMLMPRMAGVLRVGVNEGVSLLDGAAGADVSTAWDMVGRDDGCVGVIGCGVWKDSVGTGDPETRMTLVQSFAYIVSLSKDRRVKSVSPHTQNSPSHAAQAQSHTPPRHSSKTASPQQTCKSQSS